MTPTAGNADALGNHVGAALRAVRERPEKAPLAATSGHRRLGRRPPASPWTTLLASAYLLRMRFISPAQPQTCPMLPTSDAWLHEPKLDGWRVQAQKQASGVTLCSKRGIDLTTRFRQIASAVAAMPAVSISLDTEIVALDAKGRPDFLALHRGRAPVVLYAFDILHLDGLDLRELPLHERKVLLGVQVSRTASPIIRDVAGFDDGPALLAECERLRLEGVVSKRRDDAYRSGARCGWVKVKTNAWRDESRERYKLFTR